MINNKSMKKYSWIILFFLFVSAIVRLFMHIYKIENTYVDIFIAVINLVGLDYTITSIVYSIYEIIKDTIDNSNIVNQAKINKKKKHKSFIYVSIIILIIYNAIHLIFLRYSVFNDMLSMIVLGLSVTDDSIISYFVKITKI